MPLPPKGDPQRPLHLAIRSVRLLGILFVILSTCAGVGFGFAVRASAGRGLFMSIIGLVVLLFYLAPGITYIVLSIYLTQRRAWAVTTGIVVASIQLLLSLLGEVGLLLQGPHNAMAIGIGAFLILALAQLIQHLAQSYAAIRAWDGGAQRGFEPLPVKSPWPVTPVEPGPPQS